MDIFISQMIQVVMYTFATLMIIATMGLAILCFASGALSVFEAVMKGDIQPTWKRVRQIVWLRKEKA